MNMIYNSVDEVIENYLKEYNVSEDKVDAYYHNQDNMKLFCIRMIEDKDLKTLKYYRITKSGKYHLYLD